MFTGSACLFCSKLLFITCNPFFFCLNLSIETHSIFRKLCNILFYTESLFTSDFALFKGTNEILKLTAAMNKKIIELLLFSFFKVVFTAAQFKLPFPKLISFFL